MEIVLSWDLLVIIFFTVILAYSLIIGRNQTIKVIISTYIAVLSADGIGNLVERYLIGQSPIMTLLGGFNVEQGLILIKIFIFIISIILITTHGKFDISMQRPGSIITSISMTLAYGFLCAGLIVSTVFIYASGTSLLQANDLIINNAMLSVYRESELVRIMINQYNVWFSLPAIAFVVSSFIGEEE
ncbi:hypothetical protein IPJ72_01935 [Candidatus Peregrinibacteria bacterium]|nr:MAG: hypothetical protein IPJ72_01935 [Candidatus Peregrinibacteria bacterium]